MRKGELKYGFVTKKSYLYRAWNAIKYRCNNPNYKEYHLYGGRGIKVCDRWAKSFELFASDIGERPTDLHSIDRIDFNGNYEPNNCRWATEIEQQRNKRSNKWIEFDGKKMVLKQWADFLGATPINLLRMMKSKSFPAIVDYYINHRRKLPNK